MHKFSRQFLIKCILLLLLIIAGILTKTLSSNDAGFIRDHLGGIIYVVFWILFFSLVFPAASRTKLTVWVFLITCCIEFTQLIHTPALDFYRTKFIVQALFGNSFNVMDIIWYFVAAMGGGVLCAYIDRRII
jgi:hypothetical protein